MDKIDTISLYDGSVTKIKYSYSDNAPVDKLVIYVNGSGQNTYDNKRKNPKGGFFNYHDFFRNEFLSRNVAYCSYNTRGVDIGDSEPLFVTVDEDEYKKYKPLNSVKDIESIVRHLTNMPEFSNAKIFLLGWSEGTIVAPHVALRKNVKVDALLLAGYCNENMKDALIWQLSGNSSYVSLRKHFDKDKKGYISKNDYDTQIRKSKRICSGINRSKKLIVIRMDESIYPTLRLFKNHILILCSTQYREMTTNGLKLTISIRQSS